MSGLNYRPEIDGLRAVAVIPVILFHAGLTVFSGGYVGVDVFFVISGYLITAILISELERGEFSIARFYERRARRILPALFFVIICCMPFAWMWMLPSELEDFSQSVVAVVLFASNILFWREQGYFLPAAELKPLLHTWSLAVEEQYYLFFPVFLLVTWRFKRIGVFITITAIAFLSLLLAEYGWRKEPNANFYLAPTRAWELLVGSMCAFWLTGREQRINNFLSFAGLSLIVFAVLYYDDLTPFPSLYTIVPVVGTALIILYGGTGTRIAQLLSSRGFVGVGLISYSAYLWHQPLFAFARIRSISEPSITLMIALAGVSLLLAYLSWRFIESPFRKGSGSFLPTRRSVFAWSSVIAGCFLGMGLFGHFNEGYRSRLSQDRNQLYETASSSPMRELCHFDLTSKFPAKSSCTYSSKYPEIAVLGNSHGVEIAYALANNPENEKKSVLHFTVSGCQPSFETHISEYCTNFFQSRLKFIKDSKYIKHVVLTYRYENGGAISARELVKIANYLVHNQKNVVLVLQAPTLKKHIFQYIRPWVSKDELIHLKKREEWSYESRYIYNEIPNLESEVILVDAADMLCNKVICYATNSGDALYFDDNHLSVKGADMVAKVILNKLNAIDVED